MGVRWARGARLLVTGRTEKRLGETVGEVVYGGGTARHRVADVRDPASSREVVAKAHELWGRLDLVVAAAFVAGDGSPGAPSAADVWSTNLMGAFHAFDAARAGRLEGACQRIAFRAPVGVDLAPLVAATPGAHLVSFDADEDAAVEAVLARVLPRS